MTISFDIPQEIEKQIRTDGVNLDRGAKEVYLMEQYRQAKITHRQLEEALNLSFHQAEQLLKQRDMGQDLDIGEKDPVHASVRSKNEPTPIIDAVVAVDERAARDLKHLLAGNWVVPPAELGEPPRPLREPLLPEPPITTARSEELDENFKGHQVVGRPPAADVLINLR